MNKFEEFKNRSRIEAKRSLNVFKEYYPKIIKRSDFPTILAGHMMVWSFDQTDGDGMNEEDFTLFTKATLEVIAELARSYQHSFDLVSYTKSDELH